MFGQVQADLEQGCTQFPGQYEIGMIAGSRPLGLGLLAGGAGGPGDGTVGLHETVHKGLKDHLVLPASHSGLLFSTEVARQVGIFLQRGQFEVDNGVN